MNNIYIVINWNKNLHEKCHNKLTSLIFSNHHHPLVLIIVIVPLPCVWILVNATTALPDNPGPSGETNGRHAKSPTGWRTARLGGIRILSLMSFNVASPSNPPGFTRAKGYTTFASTLFFRFSWDPDINLYETVSLIIMLYDLLTYTV